MCAFVKLVWVGVPRTNSPRMLKEEALDLLYHCIQCIPYFVKPKTPVIIYRIL